MSIRVFPTALLATAVLLAPSQADAQEVPVPVTGRDVSVTLASGERLEGELIEVTDRRLLLSQPVGIQEVTLDEVDNFRVRRHQWDGSRVLAWVAIGAVVTGAGLTIACTQVENTSCGGVFAGAALSWGLVGGLFGGLLASSSWETLPVSDGDLRPYARFPQGAPPGFGR